MKWAYQVQDKMKAVAVLLLIIVLILANNIANRKTFSNLNEYIASIYKDRLMPATYIFQLTDHVYQKRLLNDTTGGNNLSKNVQLTHDTAISKLISTYETTYLTAAEKEQWATFKKELQQYNALTSDTARNDKAVNASFNKVIQCLNALSEIQAKEGSNLFKTSIISISGTVITSQLEIALLLVLGIFALVLISVNNNKLMQMQKPGLN